MRLVVAAGALLLLAGCASTVERTQSSAPGGQCLAAVRLDGVLYVERSPQRLDDGLVGEVLTSVVGEYPCNDGGPSEPMPSTKPGQALGLGPRPGSAIHAVLGYRPSFRLAATWDDRMAIFENLVDPSAHVGRDVLDLRDKVTRITARDDEGSQPRNYVDADHIAWLVKAIEGSPIGNPRSTHEFVWVDFTFRDGTTTSLRLQPSVRALDERLVLPPDVVQALTPR